MKKIINGAKYDTETAKSLAIWKSTSNTTDFSWCREILYRTKSGKYFICGEGGPMTKYATSVGNNSWAYGEVIFPMTRAAAMEWAEERLDGDEYETIFGEVAEGEGKEQLNLLVSAQLKAKLWELAEQRKVSVSALVEEALNNLVKGA